MQCLTERGCTSAVILFDPIFQGLALSLMAGVEDDSELEASMQPFHVVLQHFMGTHDIGKSRQRFMQLHGAKPRLSLATKQAPVQQTPNPLNPLPWRNLQRLW